MDNRGKILSEAEALFAAKGYDAVGVAQVVQAAGVTKPSLYHHFGSKDGLLKALLEERFLELLDGLRSAADYRGDLPLTLYRVAGFYFDFARRRPLFYRLALGLWMAPPESESCLAVRPWNERQQDLVSAIFESATRDHGNMKGRHRRYGATFLGLVNTLVGLALNGYTELNDELLFAAVHQFMHGIYS